MLVSLTPVDGIFIEFQQHKRSEAFLLGKQLGLTGSELLISMN